jgi:hypothetical protein
VAAIMVNLLLVGCLVVTGMSQVLRFTADSRGRAWTHSSW